jgi:hypothetical protein
MDGQLLVRMDSEFKGRFCGSLPGVRNRDKLCRAIAHRHDLQLLPREERIQSVKAFLFAEGGLVSEFNGEGRMRERLVFIRPASDQRRVDLGCLIQISIGEVDSANRY